MRKFLEVLIFLVCSSRYVVFTLDFKEILTPNKYTFKLVSHQYSSYRSDSNNKHTLWKGRNAKITNLAETITRIPRCLHHIINYNGIDLPESQIPLVLSRYDVVKVKYQVITKGGSRNTASSFTEWTRTFPFEKVPLKNRSGLEWCQRLSMILDMDCYDTPLVDNTPKTKPWLCEAHWYLFPPSSNSDPLFFTSHNLQYDPHPSVRLVLPAAYKVFWGFGFSQENEENNVFAFRRIPIKSRPIYDIIITKMEPADFITINAWSNTLAAANNNFINRFTTSSREEFTLKLVTQHDPETFALGEAVHFCRHCKQFESFFPVEFNGEFSKEGIKTRVQKSNLNTDNIHWGIFFLGHMFNSFDEDPDDELFNVSPYKILLSRFLNKAESLEDVRMKCEIRLLMQSVIGNVTYQVMHPVSWKHPRWGSIPRAVTVRDVRRQPVLLAAMVGEYDYSEFRIHPSSLKFVSCGEAPKEGLAYKELTSIFDNPTWVGIVVTMVSMMLLSEISLKLENERETYTKVRTTKPLWKYFVPNGNGSSLGFLAPVMALLEQGDPFASRYLRIRRLRLAICVFLLMSLVISNAYKNENVTKITLPFAPLPVNTFAALVKHSFEVFTRIRIVGGSKNLEKYFPDLTSMVDAERKGDKHDSTSLPSELYLYAMGQYAPSHLVNDSTLQNMSTEAEKMLNYTNIHPQWKSILFKGYPKTVNLLGDYCNGTALFLPDIEAIEAFYELSNIHKNHGKVFISKETLFNVDYGIQFFRWVSPNVLRRMSGLIEAGLWEWWSKFFVVFLARIKGEQADNINLEEDMSKTITLRGHISVVFVVYLFGLVVSLATFAFEAIKLVESSLRLACKKPQCK
ncbi:unnamed protein product [Orchesella dallaii]|uniref:Uncharacterized protein n=1 Tax=Orchesella dallaii TaxID=48710 RepID=A0ABP1RGE2_9HEXA